MTSQFSDRRHRQIFFRRCFVSLVKLSYWSKFHVNIIIGSRVMTISLHEIDQKSGNTKYPRLSFAQYLETGASKECQIWHERL